MSVWDAIARLWHVPRTWLAVRRVDASAAVASLALETEPARFVRLAIVPAAGPLALALAWLPGRRRREAAVTLLAALALREIDRRADGVTGRDRVRAAVGFLTGQLQAGGGREAPRASQAIQRMDPSRFDSVLGVLAARLVILRTAIEALPGDAVRRCRAMIEQLGDSVIHDRLAAEAGTPGADTFGEAVMYAMRLAAPSVRPPDATCRAVGRALELVGELEAASASDSSDARVRRDQLRIRAIAELSHVPRLARWLPGRVDSGVRAAAALVVTAACVRLLAVVAPTAARSLHAMRAAIAAARSRKAYLAAIDHAVEAVVATGPALAEGTFDGRRAPSPSPAALISPVRITISTPVRGTPTPRAASPSLADGHGKSP